jgi:hypothetical protein
MFVFSFAFRRDVSLRGGRNSGSTADADYENTVYETFTKLLFQNEHNTYVHMMHSNMYMNLNVPCKYILELPNVTLLYRLK